MTIAELLEELNYIQRVYKLPDTTTVNRFDGVTYDGFVNFHELYRVEVIDIPQLLLTNVVVIK